MHAGPTREAVHSCADAAALPAGLFAPSDDVAFSGAPRPGVGLDRLSWPTAAAAIALVCLSLWVGIGDVVSLILD